MLQIKAPPLSKTFLADSVYRSLLENILSGTLASGTEVSEVSLAEALRVSRTPVRAALARLAQDGLVQQAGGHKARVARFGRGDLREIYDMRKLLESAAAERAADRMDPATLASLRREADALDRARPDAGASTRLGASWITRALEFDVRFHDALAAACGNGRLRGDIARYRLLVRAFCRLTGSLENLRQALREHRDILKALEARDAARARKAMAAHVDARLRVLLKEICPEGA